MNDYLTMYIETDVVSRIDNEGILFLMSIYLIYLLFKILYNLCFLLNSLENNPGATIGWHSHKTQSLLHWLLLSHTNTNFDQNKEEYSELSYCTTPCLLCRLHLLYIQNMWKPKPAKVSLGECKIHHA